MTPTVLVVSSVHWPDDTRIRERLIPTLGAGFDVLFAAREPGPSNRQGLTWLALNGGRAARSWSALRVLLTTSWQVAVVHDPELVPFAVLARWVRRRPVVFDVHEDLAAQIVAKEWIPRWLRPVARRGARITYWMADRFLEVTLAEARYQTLFSKTHPVFENYPRYEGWPDPSPRGDGRAIYVGDTQAGRGIEEAIEACRRAGIGLTIVGPLFDPAPVEGVEMTGRLTNRDALDRVASSSAGLSLLRPLPNYVESTPTKVLEYLGMGVPLVATDLPGTRRVVEGLDAVWLVPPGDIDAMAEAVASAVADESRQAAQRQVAEVRSRYRWPEEAVLAYYRSLINL